MLPPLWMLGLGRSPDATNLTSDSDFVSSVLSVPSVVNKHRYNQGNVLSLRN